MTPLQDVPPIPDLDDVDLLGLTPESVNSSQEWLQRWLQAIHEAPLQCQVPLAASAITTPLVPSAWRTMLISHPQPPLVHFFLHEISAGFRIGYNLPSIALKSAKKNMRSAYDHATVVADYLATELAEGRVVGPFPPSMIPSAHVSRFGVIPKSHQLNKWRLIIDLSHPHGKSVNDGVQKDLCSMAYISVDDAIRKIISLGKGTLLAKIDIKSAFRLIPVHPADRHLLAMEWQGSLYIDTCLPFGLRSAPKLFNVMADLLEWILLNQGVTFLLHYLDDFLTMGQSGTTVCQCNLDLLVQTCRVLGIPLAIEKVDGPATVLEFLGILLDTDRMEARLPQEKFERIKTTIEVWLHRKNATKREVLSLVGILQHAAKVIRPGRTFVSRMYSTAAKVQELDYFTRLNKEFQSDLYWWHVFLGMWNGVSFLQPKSTPDATIQTDASGSWGCAAFYRGQWLQWEWPAEWANQSIMAKELVPIVFSCTVWGKCLARKVILFQCDNTGVVSAIRKGSANESMVMHLLRALWFFVAYFDITILIEHIPGIHNGVADQLSRNHMQQFFSSNPQAHLLPTPLPLELQQIVSVAKPDWTSQRFTLLFNTTILKV